MSLSEIIFKNMSHVDKSIYICMYTYVCIYIYMNIHIHSLDIQVDTKINNTLLIFLETFIQFQTM